MPAGQDKFREAEEAARTTESNKPEIVFFKAHAAFGWVGFFILDYVELALNGPGFLRVK